MRFGGVEVLALASNSVLAELKNALRSGDIWVPGSRQFLFFFWHSPARGELPTGDRRHRLSALLHDAIARHSGCRAIAAGMALRDRSTVGKTMAAKFSCNSCFLGREFLSFSLRKIFELLFGHRLRHLFGRAFKAGFAGFATLGCQCCARGHLLFF
jgi:hypothetical protein